VPDSLFAQPVSKSSLVNFLVWHPPLHTPYIHGVLVSHDLSPYKHISDIVIKANKCSSAIFCDEC